jgi:uncharacterized protein YvpB
MPLEDREPEIFISKLAHAYDIIGSSFKTDISHITKWHHPIMIIDYSDAKLYMTNMYICQIMEISF